MTARSNGEGSVYRRRDGRWAGAAYVLSAGGVRRRKTVYARTRAEVYEKLSAMQEQSRRGLPAVQGGQTVAAFLEMWVRDILPITVREKTLLNYRMIVEQHLIPGLGRRRLAGLRATEIRMFLQEQRERGFSVATIKTHHAVLRAALQHAVREDLLARNVARLVVVEAPRTGQFEPFDLEESRAFLAAAQGHSLRALWTVALSMGLRRGEALALRWRDVDIGGRQLWVRRSLQWINGRIVITDPKTVRSVRALPIPAVCVRALVEHRESEEAKAVRLGQEFDVDRLVFTSTVGGPLNPDNVKRAFHQLLVDAGLRRIRMHDLRHTCATLLLAQGVAPRVVMDLLGHSAIAVTMNTYAHVMPTMLHDAAVQMDSALSPELDDDPDGDS